MKPPVITLLDYIGTQEHTSKPDREDEREEERKKGRVLEQESSVSKSDRKEKVKERLVFLFLSFFFVKRKTNPLEQILVYSSFCNICPTS